MEAAFYGLLYGEKTLPITYDPFFKCIFHSDVHPERLSRFLSSILGEKVKVVRILPQEDTLLDGTALLIMDILVELENGALCNVDYSDFRIIPINLFKDRFHKTSKQVYRNNCFNNLVQVG